MEYYKIIVDDTIVDVMCNPAFVKQYKKINIICDVSDAMGIVSSDASTTYQIIGAPLFTNNTYESVSVADITIEEYEELKSILSLGGTIDNIDTSVDWDEQTSEVDIQEVNKAQTLAEAKNRKIAMLRDDCQKAIFAGVDVELASGEVKHFDLQLEDQINLITLSNLIASGVTEVPYHATGEVCVYYNAEDVNTIVAQSNAFKTYHTTYFNSLKTWVNALKSVSSVCAIQYGDEIPVKYCSEVLFDINNKTN